MRRTLFGLLTITLVGAALASAAARTWTDRTGQQFDGEYIAFSDGEVEIKRTSDGKTFHVPIERFSDADQEFVRSQIKATAAPNVLPEDGQILLEDDNTADYLQRLQTWYDPRPERTVFLARAGAPNMKDAISWAERYLAAIGERGWDRTRVFIAVPRWRVIWKNDRFDKAKAQPVLARAPGMVRGIGGWQTALSPHNGGSEVPREIAITLICEIDSLFQGKNYQADRGRMMQKRLRAIPVQKARDLGNVLWVSDAHAAMLLAEYDPLFSTSGQFNETVYSTVLSELKVRCPKHSPQSK
jgi:hypothetical protein